VNLGLLLLDLCQDRFKLVNRGAQAPHLKWPDVASNDQAFQSGISRPLTLLRIAAPWIAEQLQHGLVACALEWATLDPSDSRQPCPAVTGAS